MANIQKQFEAFHAAIRTDYEMNETLRAKRDIVLDKISDALVADGLPTFKRLMQGSYQMKTGVKPMRDEPYDIDVGLRFELSENEKKASEVRQWVFDRIDGHTRTGVEDKGPCIRVSYADGFHVDLVVYAMWTDAFNVVQYRLAHRERGWVAADPQKLLDHVAQAASRFRGSEGGTQIDQLRRIIRILKRWDDVHVPDGSAGKLSGLAFTLMAIQHLPSAVLAWDGKPDDCGALQQIANMATNCLGAISAKKPTPEYEDMFAALTSEQMTALKERFGQLAAAASFAEGAKDPVKACERLREILGDDFPVPDASDTAVRTSGPAIVTSSSSA